MTVTTKRDKFSPAEMSRAFPSLSAALNSGATPQGTVMAKAATGEMPTKGDQGVIFAELGDTPEDKAIIKLCKQLLKIRVDRKEALNESKAKEDELQTKVVELMHESKYTAFSFDSLKVELVKNSEKIKIKPAPKVDDEDDADAE